MLQDLLIVSDSYCIPFYHKYMSKCKTYELYLKDYKFDEKILVNFKLTRFCKSLLKDGCIKYIYVLADSNPNINEKSLKKFLEYIVDGQDNFNFEDYFEHNLEYLCEYFELDGTSNVKLDVDIDEKNFDKEVKKVFSYALSKQDDILERLENFVDDNFLKDQSNREDENYYIEILYKFIGKDITYDNFKCLLVLVMCMTIRGHNTFLPTEEKEYQKKTYDADFDFKSTLDSTIGDDDDNDRDDFIKRYIGGYILEKLKEQTSSTSKKDLEKFCIIMRGFILNSNYYTFSTSDIITACCFLKIPRDLMDKYIFSSIYNKY
jgi:hypothetical protein